jgi:hypothetical protein
MPKPVEPNYDGLIRGAKYMGEWFSSLFNNKPEPT